MGFRENLNNVSFLSKAQRRRNRLNLDQLKSGYQDFLKSIQPALTVGQSKKLRFVKDLAAIKKLMSFYFVNSHQKQEGKSLKDTVNRVRTLPEGEKKILLLREAHDRIHQLDREWAILVNLVINKIFYFGCKGMGGGSTPFAIGIIWANPNSSWGRDDFVEFYAHELSHQLLFLDDERYRHYRDYEKLKLEKNYAISTIRNGRRRLDLTMHSLVVGVEIILLRDRVLGHPKDPTLHPKTDKLIENCLQTTHSITSIPRWRSLFSKRGTEILLRCQEVLNSFE